MAAKRIYYPYQIKKGGDKSRTYDPRQHIIRRRLDDMGQDVAWLAGKLGIHTSSIYNHINGKSHLKQIHFSRLLVLLDLDENTYHGINLNAGRTQRPVLTVISKR